MFAAPLWRMLEGQIIKDQYYLQQVLGTGTFGGVFRTDQVVRDTILRTLATKVIFINQPELVSYQLRELQVALNFDHPNLIKCHDAGEAKIEKLSISCLYLLMELAEETLENKLKRGNISTEEVKVIVENIAEGLAYLHEKEQVHLDLKPANILKVNGHWKIGDYGLVRSLDPQRSYMETMNFSLGTTAYSPPESYQGIIAPAWDMWSLGIITVMLLKGKYPIQFQTQEELGEKIKAGQFNNLNWDDLEEPWWKIIQGCLQVNRQQRWTAKQVLSELNSENIPVLTIILPGGIELEMIKIPAGSFLMGSADNEFDAYASEKPQHRVTLQEYYLGKYPVTQEQYQAVMGNNPSRFKDNSNNPVEQVIWNDAKAFCQKLKEITGKEFRLPTEAEWEYGCRAGTTTPFYFGETTSTEQANYNGNYTFGEGKKGIYREKTTPVGSFPANKFGLYDMHGNVWEWCEDSWHDSYAEKPESIKQNGNTLWSSSNELPHILRGGSWSRDPRYCRSAIRRRGGKGSNYNGFRLALPIQVRQTSEPTIIQFATPPVSLSSSSPNPPVLTLDLPTNVKLEMIKIPAGSFLMGSADNDPDAYNEEKPQHRVTLQEYYLGKYPVTQEQYQAVMGNNPSGFDDDLKNPVEQVSWNDAKTFCQKLYEITEKKVRLPTEAEWEYGCRAGTTTPFYFGETISTEQANYNGNHFFAQKKGGIYREKTTPVGSFPMNKFGLYDMHGNVWEWCEDSWHESYAEKPENLKSNGNTIWLSAIDQGHHLRGGSWHSKLRDCRSACRDRFLADYWDESLGFRLALSIS